MKDSIIIIIIITKTAVRCNLHILSSIYRLAVLILNPKPHLFFISYVHFAFFFIEPNAPPSNVQGRKASSTSILVQWGDVPTADQNGIILSYTVKYTALPGGSEQTKVVNAPANETTVTELNEYTNYSITVFASTSKGGGNVSEPIIIITDEDSKFDVIL